LTRAVAVGLKIPDNTAYTALVALRRLGIAVEHVDRNEIWFFDDDGDAAALAARVKADETIFNPNKHRLVVLDAPGPRAGEVWVEPLVAPVRGPACIAWRLLNAHGSPAGAAVLSDAVDRLLCNPAIERARV
jgi:phosphoribosylformylglycinamidine (FGAM) synthase PurS component